MLGPFPLLAFLMGLGAGSLLLLLALRKRSRPWGVRIILGLAIWVLGYLGLVLSVSIASPQRELELGEEMKFCGFYLDCHLGVTVVGVDKLETVGARPHEKTALGTYYVVRLRVRSDARRATLSFSDPSAWVGDQTGRKFIRDREAEKLLSAASGHRLELPIEIEAGGDAHLPLVFDLPPEAANPRLFVTEGCRIERWLEYFLLGDEDSLFHRKSALRLEPRA